jgi:hypothetical protein
VEGCNWVTALRTIQSTMCGDVRLLRRCRRWRRNAHRRQLDPSRSALERHAQERFLPWVGQAVPVKRQWDHSGHRPISLDNRHLHSGTRHWHLASSEATVCPLIWLASPPRPLKGHHGREPGHSQHGRLPPRQSRAARGPILRTGSQAKPETASYYQPEYRSNGFVILCSPRRFLVSGFAATIGGDARACREIIRHFDRTCSAVAQCPLARPLPPSHASRSQQNPPNVIKHNAQRCSSKV